MRFSFPIGIIVLVGSTALLWWGRSSLIEARSEYNKLKRQADALGVRVTDEGIPVTKSGAKPSKRKGRREREAEVESLLEDVRALALKKYSRIERFDNMMPLGARLAKLDAGQLRMLDKMVRDSANADEDNAFRLLSTYQTLLVNLVKHRPNIAMDHLFNLHTSDIKGVYLKDFPYSSLLSNWASLNPAAAGEWYQENKDALDNSIGYGYLIKRFRKKFINGAAKNDPEEAYQMMKRLGLEKDFELYEGMVKNMQGNEKMNTTLSILRRVCSQSEGGNSGRQYIGMMAVGDKSNPRSFERATEWIDQADLTDEELMSVANMIKQVGNTPEKKRWLQWFQESDLSDDDKRDARGAVLQAWANQDIQAAGEWALEQPEGKLRDEAAGFYADALFYEFRDDAVIWLQSLPQGEMRRSISERFYDEWPAHFAEDRVAADAFAESEGLSVEQRSK